MQFSREQGSPRVFARAVLLLGALLLVETESHGQSMVSEGAQRSESPAYRQVIAQAQAAGAEASGAKAALEPAADPHVVSAAQSEAAEKLIVLQSVEQWRQAWQAQDVEAYIAKYVPDFQPSNGLSHQDWRHDRHRKLQRPKTISVRLGDVHVKRGDGPRWKVVFRQVYQSDSYQDSVQKELTLIKAGATYVIEQELTR